MSAATPAIVPPAGWTIPIGYGFVNLAWCRGCDARIAWASTPTGRRAPLDRDGTNHFATCPDAERFRRRLGRQPGAGRPDSP